MSWLLVFAALGLLVSSSFFVLPTVQAQSSRTRSSAIELFLDVYSIASATYVDSVADTELIEAAITGMLEDLDPNSVLLTPEEFENLRIQLEGSFEGIGVTIGQRDGWLTIISPIEGTPAHRIGVRGGDRVVEIDGQTTFDMTTQEAVSILRGPRGTEVTITVVRPGLGDSLHFDIVRDVIDYPSVSASFLIDGDIGYLRLSRFAEESCDEVVRDIRDLQSQGAASLILDLRNNSGGLFTPAIEIADLFLPAGALVVTTRGNAVGEHSYETSRGVLFRGDLVVLVNGGSASSSEILAGALQDHGAATIVGTRTFGKGSVQSLSDLGDYSGLGHYAVKLTTARYYTPSGRGIDRTLLDDFMEPGAEAEWGIEPDIVIEETSIDVELVADLEYGGYFFGFASEYTTENPDLDEAFWPDESVISAFRGFLSENGFEWREESFDEALPYIERALLREIALRIWSMDTYYRILAPQDEYVQRALELLGHGSQAAPDPEAALESSPAPL
ncbi:S41 family peptidase [Candidatus Fermentibacterales bacterium]|nr:S41 family peptidase [Candidatus Fermentibacterales bacterium]